MNDVHICICICMNDKNVHKISILKDFNYRRIMFVWPSSNPKKVYWFNCRILYIISANTRNILAKSGEYNLTFFWGGGRNQLGEENSKFIKKRMERKEKGRKNGKKKENKRKRK